MGATARFAASALGVIPTAALMGRATRSPGAPGPGIGGLLNVTFGNAPELIIALFALSAGSTRSSRPRSSARSWATSCSSWAPPTLVGGLEPRAPGVRPHGGQRRSRSMLLLATAIVMPAIFELIEGNGLPDPGPRRINYDARSRHLPRRRDRPDRHLRGRPALLLCVSTATNFNPVAGEDEEHHEERAVVPSARR